MNISGRIGILGLGVLAAAVGLQICTELKEHSKQEMAFVTCHEYHIPKVEKTMTFYNDKENQRTFTADTLCTAQTSKGEVKAYLDTSKYFQGFSNPLGENSDLLVIPKSLERKVTVFDDGYGPCVPSPQYLGLNKFEGMLVRYEQGDKKLF